jgi:hypothetical protein
VKGFQDDKTPPASKKHAPVWRNQRDVRETDYFGFASPGSSRVDSDLRANFCNGSLLTALIVPL